MFIYIFSLFIIFISFFVHYYPAGPDYWWSKWSLLMFVLSLVLARGLWKKVHWVVGLTWGWIAFQAVHTFSWFTNRYESIKPQDYILISYYVLVFYVCFILFAYLLMAIKSKDLKVMNSLFIFLCVSDAIFVIIQYFMGYDYVNRGGMFGNGSINACFIAITYPLVMQYVLKVLGLFNDFSPRKIIIGTTLLILPFLAVMISQTSVAVGGLAVSIASYLFFMLKGKYKIIVPSILIVLVLSFGYISNLKLDLAHGDSKYAQFFDDSMRLGLYKINFLSWANRGSIYFGDGPGSFPVFGIDAQIKYGYMKNSWAIWLHNDWLQMLFELGFFGFLVIMLFSFVLLIKAHSRPFLMSSILSYMSIMLLNYPLHYPIHALFAVYLVAEAFKNSPKIFLFEKKVYFTKSRR